MFNIHMNVERSQYRGRGLYGNRLALVGRVPAQDIITTDTRNMLIETRSVIFIPTPPYQKFSPLNPSCIYGYFALQAKTIKQ